MKCFLVVALCVLISSLGANAQVNPVPLTYQPLVPGSVTPGSPGFVLTVNGAGFVSTSIVNWNGSPLGTTFVSKNTLTAAVPASKVAHATTASVTVFNPAPGGGKSNVVPFTVTNPTSSLNFATSFPTAGGQPNSVLLADFNGDGILDMALFQCPEGNCGNILSPQVSGSLLLGHGDGTFSKKSDFTTIGPPESGIVGDFNGDGRPDLVVMSGDNGSGASITIFLNNGDGTFGTGQRVSGADGQFTGIAAGDFNHDGKLDLAVSISEFEFIGVVIYFGSGDGTFSGGGGPDPSDISHPSTLFTADFNGDGILDLAVVDPGSSVSNGLTIFLGNGDGTFSVAPTQPPVASCDAVADFNGDGIPDLALSNASNPLVILLGNGDGTFTGKNGQPDGPNNFSLSPADLNGDGVLDLVALNVDGTVGVYLGNGDGTFQAPRTLPGLNSTPSIGDLNGDGRLDMAAVGDGDSVAVLMQTPSVSAAPDLLSFGTQALGTTSSPLSATLSNLGSSPITISSAQATGDFQIQTNNCANTLAAGSTCSVAVTFTPTGTGTRMGTLSFKDDAFNTPQTVALSGVGGTAQATTTGLISSISPSHFGQTIKLTASVTSAASGQPSGTVTFYDGPNPLAAAPLKRGTAKLTIPELSTGDHSLTAYYSGDTIFGPSTSPVLTQGVSEAHVKVALSSSPNPVGVFDNVTFSVVVSGGPATPTGSVTLKKGTATLATIPLAFGQAKYSTFFQQGGNFRIVASYSGDQNYDPRNSNVVKQVVTGNPAATAPTSNRTVPTKVGQ
jgi:hypothetical protein